VYIRFRLVVKMFRLRYCQFS